MRMRNRRLFFLVEEEFELALRAVCPDEAIPGRAETVGRAEVIAGIQGEVAVGTNAERGEDFVGIVGR